MADLLLPQMSQRKAVICKSLAALQDDAARATKLAKEVASTQSSSAETTDSGNTEVGLDQQVSRLLKPVLRRLLDSFDVVQSGLLSSLESLAVAERNLKFAQALGAMDLDEAAQLVKVRLTNRHTSFIFNSSSHSAGEYRHGTVTVYFFCHCP